MDQPRNPPAPLSMVTGLAVRGYRRHGPISVVLGLWPSVPRVGAKRGAPRRSYGYAFLAPPWIWGRGAPNVTRRTPSTAF